MKASGRWIRRGTTIALLDVNGRQYEAEFEDLELPASGARPTVRRDSRGSAVAEVQTRLKALGYDPGPVDGIFGSGTEAAVKAFQRARGLVADGVVGPLTWGQLDASGGSRQPSSPPTPARPPSGVAGRVLAETRRHLGFHEGPNNDNPFSAHFGVRNVPWCAYFVSYVYSKAGVPLNIGSSDGMLQRLIDTKRFFKTVPQPADIVIFDWTQGDHDPAEHVGIVESISRDAAGGLRVHTIEGNSSDGVNRREYPFGSPTIVGYGRLP